MKNSKAYYIVRGIARAITQMVIAGIAMGLFYIFYLCVWSMS